ncbi:MAG: YqgE/AlgH family protein [Flavobacteriales bacterium]|nr:YqgE/AlgH family protein [Flavobacteriales bacterium]MCX7649822.1 YqgE/AlgH family protein [Flavobacteriales bacterium]MDW8431354.1 YqgE/AlgH family protein [Flavobacteriales bacterium]
MTDKDSDVQVGQGTLLVASPFLRDGNFRRSVVLIAEHDAEGSLGFILNQMTSLTLGQVLPGIADHWPIYYGGPVGNDSLFYLHSLGPELEGARHILGSLWWGGAFNQLRALLEKDQVPRHALKFFAGYSGWGQGQLASELEEESWILKPGGTLNVLESETDHLWRRLILSEPAYALWFNMPDAPYLN